MEKQALPLLKRVYKSATALAYIVQNPYILRNPFTYLQIYTKNLKTMVMVDLLVIAKD